MRTYRFFDTISGNPIFSLPAVDRGGSHSRKVTGAGSAQYTVPLQGIGLSRDVARLISEPNGVSFAVVWGSHVEFAGPVQAVDYSRDTRSMTVRAKELRPLFSQRLTFGVLNYGQGDLTVSNRSLSGAARAVLARAMQWGELWELPVDLPADGSGTFSAEWKNYQCLTIEDLLQQIEKAGTEIDFRPYLTSAGALRYETRLGNPIKGAQTDLPVSTKKSRVIGLTVQRDGTNQLSGVFYGGNGSEADMLTASGFGAAGPRIPVRDAFRSAKDVTDPTRLQVLAQENLRQYRSPLEQWSFSVKIGGGITPDKVQVGQVLKMSVYGDSFIPDGEYVHRVIGVSGGTDMNLALEVQPA